MELILKDLSVKSVKKDQVIKKVNYTFKDNCITYCYGISVKVLRDLLIQHKKQTSGYIMINDHGYVSDIGYLGNNPLKELKCKNFREEVIRINEEYGLNIDNIDNKIGQSLLMVGLNERYQLRSYNTLSLGELKKINLALILIANPKIIIVDYYEKGLNYKDLCSLKNILKKLKNKYQINVIVCSDDLDKYINIVDKFVIFDKGIKVLEGNIDAIYNEEIYRYIEMPAIISFVKNCRSRGHDLLDYIDLKELIKAIYRDVEAK